MAYVATDIKTRLEQSKAQLTEFVRQRDQLNVAIVQLQNEIRALTAIVWRDELAQRQNDMQQAVVGITDAIRSVLRLKNVPMTAAQVKADLDLMGYDFAGLANASALVHNTLKRMIGTYEVSYDPKDKTYRALPINFIPMNTPGGRRKRIRASGFEPRALSDSTGR